MIFSLKKLCCLTILFCLISFPVRSELIYQQDLTLTTWKSKEELETKVRDFCNAAKGDPDIKVISVKYREKKERKNQIAYEAVITCHVSKIDEDFMRINGKIFQQKYLPAQTDKNN